MRRKLLRAASFLATDAAARGVAFTVVMAAARFLGPAEFGRFAFAYGLVAIALLVSDFGLTPLLLRRFARDGVDRGVFWSATLVNVCAAAVVYGGAVLALRAVFPERAGVLELYGAVLLVQAVASSTDAVLFSRSRTTRVGLIRLGGNVTLALAAVVALVVSRSAAALVVAFVVANLVKLALSYASARRDVGAPVFAAAVARRLVRAALPFFGAALLSFLYFRIDVVLLGVLAPARAVGEYAAAYRFVDALMLVPTALAYTFFPGWMRGEGRARDTRHVLRAIALAGAGAAVLLLALAGPLTSLVLGSAYGDAAVVLRILALGMPVLFVDVLAVWLAYGAGNERGVVAVSGCALVANLALNAALIPALGARGAAIATVASELVNLSGYAFMFRRRLFARPRLVEAVVEA